MAWDKKAILDAIKAELQARPLEGPMLGQHMTYHEAVLDRLEDELSSRYPLVEHRGFGGSGEVVKLISQPSPGDSEPAPCFASVGH